MLSCRRAVCQPLRQHSRHMRVLVGVKRVIDYAVKVRVKDDGSGVNTENVRSTVAGVCLHINVFRCLAGQDVDESFL